MAAVGNDSSIIVDVYDSNGLRLGAYSKPFEVTAVAVYISIGVLGICLNACTIYVINCSKKTNKSCKGQMINLAVADMVTGTLMPVYLIYHTLLLPFPDSEVLTKLLCFFGYTFFYSGPLCNAAISIERFVAVYFPFTMLRYGPRRKALGICLIWVISVSCSLEGLIFGKVKYFKEEIYGSQVPMPVCHYSHINEPAYITHMVLKYTIPPAIISVMYLLIIIKMCQQPKIQQATSARHDTSNKCERQKRQVVKMLAINAFVTILTWTPFEVLCALGADHDQRYTVVTAVLVALQLSSCFTTPIIYYMFNDALRAEFHRQALRVCRRTTRSYPSSSMVSQKRAVPISSSCGRTSEVAPPFMIAPIRN